MPLTRVREEFYQKAQSFFGAPSQRGRRGESGQQRVVTYVGMTKQGGGASQKYLCGTFGFLVNLDSMFCALRMPYRRLGKIQHGSGRGCIARGAGILHG